jgi:hypothetical protein
VQAASSRRYKTRLALNDFNFHAGMLRKPAKTEKPTVGFQARFFWNGFKQRKSMAINGLRDSEA